MTRDDIIRMAREAHHELVTQDYPGHLGQLDPWTLRLLERFANLVAKHEREACAKVCDRMVMYGPVAEVQQRYNKAYADCRDKIRERGEK